MTTSGKFRSTYASQPVYRDPIKMHAGDRLEVAGEEEDGWVWCRHEGGKESWVPLSYLSAGDASRTALVEYDATELPVEEGEEFDAILEEHGWLWCKNPQGQLGWVRLAQVERLAEPS
jgi:uncharacterized protein YgiM (DUF1202 family)